MAAFTAAVFATVSPPVRAQPADELALAVAFGYDANPAQWHDSPGLAFSRYALDAARRLRFGGHELKLGLGGWYRDFEGANDSHRLAAQAIWSRPSAQGSALFSVGATLAAHRDALVMEDNRNEANLEVRYDLTLSARDMLGISAELGGMRYLSADEACSSDPESDHRSRAGKGGRGRHAGQTGARDDRQAGLALDLTHHWSPDLSTMLSIASTRHDSPLPVEAYRRNAFGLTAQFQGLRQWNLELGLGWSEAAYDRAPRHRDRRDVQWTTGLAARRTWSGREVTCSLDWLESDSTLDARSYRQVVTQCGLSWSF